MSIFRCFYMYMYSSFMVLVRVCQRFNHYIRCHAIKNWLLFKIIYTNASIIYNSQWHKRFIIKRREIQKDTFVQSKPDSTLLVKLHLCNWMKKSNSQDKRLGCFGFPISFWRYLPRSLQFFFSHLWFELSVSLSFFSDVFEDDWSIWKMLLHVANNYFVEIHAIQVFLNFDALFSDNFMKNESVFSPMWIFLLYHPFCGLMASNYAKCLIDIKLIHT